MKPHITIEGEVVDVFAHRFVVATSNGRVLADLGPEGAAKVALRQGHIVELTGEMKPSELKVHRLVRGDTRITIDREHPPEHEHADPAPALATVRANGFTPVGEPRRKPKHFEILGRDSAGDLVELHISLDGALRKTKPATHDPRWPASAASP